MKPLIVLFFMWAILGMNVYSAKFNKHKYKSGLVWESDTKKSNHAISRKSLKIEELQSQRGSSLISNIVKGSTFRRLESQLKISEDAHLPITKLVPKYGYPLEVHEVVTEDGYILTMHRIPHGKNDTQKKKRPLLVIHGLLCSADDWIVLGPEISLGYVFADADYDVWLGNVRGTKHSRSHVRLSPKNLDFWQFHIDEIGLYDVPAMIDYILEETNENQLYYIGYSQGTTAFFMMCSARPEYNKKVKIMTALAPVTENWHNISPVMQFLFRQNKNINNIVQALTGTLEFLPLGELVNVVGELTCNGRAVTQNLCANFYFLSGGYDWQQLNQTMLPVIFGHFPSSCSVGQIAQFDQLQKTGELKQFDYGVKKNNQIYGSSHAPLYNISKITAPVFLIYGRNDWDAFPKGVKHFHHELRNKVGVYYVKNARFTHLDFVWAKDVKKLVYDIVIDKMKLY